MEDTQPPTVQQCPDDINVIMSKTGATSFKVEWDEPTAVDESGNVTLLFNSHTSGQSFGIGYTSVLYQFVDSSNNMATCRFFVNVKGGNQPYEFSDVTKKEKFVHIMSLYTPTQPYFRSV